MIDSLKEAEKELKSSLKERLAAVKKNESTAPVGAFHFIISFFSIDRLQVKEQD